MADPTTCACEFVAKMRQICISKTLWGTTKFHKNIIACIIMKKKKISEISDIDFFMSLFFLYFWKKKIFWDFWHRLFYVTIFFLYFCITKVILFLWKQNCNLVVPQKPVSLKFCLCKFINTSDVAQLSEPT